MKTPKNCRECKHTHTCRAAHYGGSFCKYAKEINRAIIAAQLNKK